MVFNRLFQARWPISSVGIAWGFARNTSSQPLESGTRGSGSTLVSQALQVIPKPSSQRTMGTS